MLQLILDFLSNPLAKDWFAPFAVSVLVPAVLYVFRPKSRIIWSHLHGSVFLLPGAKQSDGQNGPPISVHTRTVLIQNIGKATADSIEVYWPFKLENFELWPRVKYSEETLGNGTFVLMIERMVPKELVMIELLNVNNQIPDVTRVRSANHEGIQLAMIWQRVFPKWFNLLVGALMMLGLFTATRWTLSFLALIMS